jgi:hypothetical protein
MAKVPLVVASLYSLALGLVVVACGGNTSNSGSGGAATGGSGGGGTGGSATGGGPTGGTGGIDCSTVGCGAPPMCDVGCTSACGCCDCGEGEIIDSPSGPMICTGGCYAPAKACGGIAGTPCDADEFCDYGGGCAMDDASGVCKKRPQGCTADCPGACGCDGKFYCNGCAAHATGMDTDPTATCNPGDAGAGTACQSDNECQPGLKCCYPCGIPGCQNSCMAPDPSGQCPMFP